MLRFALRAARIRATNGGPAGLGGGSCRGDPPRIGSPGGVAGGGVLQVRVSVDLNLRDTVILVQGEPRALDTDSAGWTPRSATRAHPRSVHPGDRRPPVPGLRPRTRRLVRHHGDRHQGIAVQRFNADGVDGSHSSDGGHRGRHAASRRTVLRRWPDSGRRQFRRRPQLHRDREVLVAGHREFRR